MKNRYNKAIANNANWLDNMNEKRVKSTVCHVESFATLCQPISASKNTDIGTLYPYKPNKIINKNKTEFTPADFIV